MVCGDQIRLDAAISELVCGRLADGGNGAAGEGTGVARALAQSREEEVDGAGAGEQDRGERGETVDGSVEGRTVVRELQVDERQQGDFGAVRFEKIHERAGLFPLAGDQQPFAEKRSALEPVQLLVQMDYFADEDEGWRFGLLNAHFLFDVDQIGDNRSLSGIGASLDSGDRGGRWTAVGEKLLSYFADLAHPHKDDQGAVERGELAPVDRRSRFVRILVPSDQHCRCGQAPVRQGDAGVGGYGGSSRYSGDDFEADAGGGQLHRLFRAPAVNAGIAPFEAHDFFPLAALGEEERVDLFLGMASAATLLAYIDLFTGGVSKIEKAMVEEFVVEEDIRLPQAMGAFDGEQGRVTRAGADDVHAT